jgi:hypothetical protein
MSEILPLEKIAEKTEGCLTKYATDEEKQLL